MRGAVSEIRKEAKEADAPAQHRSEQSGGT